MSGRENLTMAEPVQAPAAANGRDATKSDAFKGVAIRTVALAVFLAVAVAVLRSTILFVPAAAGAILLYLASVIGVVLTGRMAGPLRTSMQAFAVTVFCTLLVASPGMRMEIRNLWLPVLLLGTVWAVHFTAKAYASLAGVITRALLVGMVGYLYYYLFAASNVLLLPQLGLVVFVGFFAAAAASFIGVLSRHSDARIASVGRAFYDLWNPAKAGLIVAVIATYLIFIRPTLAVAGTLLLTLIEWAVVCLLIFVAFRKIRAIMPAEEGLSFGDGHRAAGVLCHDKGELDRAAAKVREFVATGRKDGLVTLAATALLSNGVPADAAEDVLSIIVSYSDEPEPPAIFRWAVGDMAEHGRRRRRKVLDELMAAMAAATAAAAGSGATMER